MTTICPYPYEENEYCEDPPKLSREGFAVARKVHRCSECYEAIPVGMRYGKLEAVLESGHWQTWRRCASCVILAELVATINGECPLWGGLEYSVDYVNEERPEGATEVPSPWRFRKQWEAE